VSICGAFIVMILLSCAVNMLASFRASQVRAGPEIVVCATCRATPCGVAKAKNEHQMMPASRKEYIPRVWGSA
jgi:hypothetical protein